ncbi:MAG: type II toxin-antitoxin system VapC family toxin [Nitrososphaerales archaeon]
MKEPVYVDSNVFILPVVYGDSDRGKVAADLLRKIENGEVIAYTSTLTWDEVVWVVLKLLGKADSVETGRKLIKFPNLRFVDADESVIIKSQQLVEKYQMKPRDAIHCASAIAKNLKMLISDDGDFEVAQEIKRIPLESFA